MNNLHGTLKVEQSMCSGFKCFFAILILDKHLFAKISSENFPLPRLLSFIDAGQVQKSFEELLANPIGIKHKNIIFLNNMKAKDAFL